MYLGNFYVMYNIGTNIPSLLDRVLIKCERIYWYKPTVSNKLPVFLIPIEISDQEPAKLIPFQSVLSPSDTYYIATIHDGHIYVIYKLLDENFDFTLWSQKTASMRYKIDRNATTFQKIPSLGVYFIGEPNKPITNMDNYSTYRGPLFLQNQQPLPLPIAKPAQPAVALVKQPKEKQTTKSNGSMSYLWIVIGVIVLIVIIVIIVLVARKS